MNKAYSRINWQNQPSTSTALGATNLNKMDIALNSIDDRVITLDTTKLDLTTANSMVKSFSLDQSTGVIKITLLDGTVTTYDTKLEKLAVNFAYDATAQQLVITLDDGTKQYVDMSALITQYEFKDSSTVGFSVDASGKVSASVKNGSITADKLQPNYLADITAQQQTATAQAKLAKRYAVGGVETGDTTDNAKYYKEQAELFKTQAKQYRDEAQDISNVGIAGETKLGLVKGDGNVGIESDGDMWAEPYKDKGTATGTFINFKSADDAFVQINAKGITTATPTNPDLPISPDNKLILSNTQNFDIVSCVNLFDDSIPRSFAGNTYDPVTRTYTLASSSPWQVVVPYINLTLKPNEKYTIQAKVVQNGTLGSVGIFVMNGELVNTSLSAKSTTLQTDIIKVTFTTPSHGKVQIRLHTNSTPSSVSGLNSSWSNIMIAYGDAYSAYIPYKEDRINIPYPMRSLPSGYDEIKSGQHTQNVGNLILDGTETLWSLQSINSYGIANFSIPLNSNATGGTSGLCNLFKPQDSTIAVTTDEGFLLANKTTLYIRVKKERASTVEQFKTLLAQWKASGSPLTVQYPLVTPVITDLNTYLKTFKGTTNIYTTANPQVELTATFKSELWTRDYLQDLGLQALQSGKLDANKVLNSDIATIPGFAWDAVRGAAARKDIDALIKQTGITDARGTNKKPSEYPTQRTTREFNTSMPIGIPVVYNWQCIVETTRPWVDLSGTSVQKAFGYDENYIYREYVRYSSDDMWGDWGCNNINIIAVSGSVSIASLLTRTEIGGVRKFTYINPTISTNNLPSDYPQNMKNANCTFNPLVEINRISNGIMYVKITSPNHSTGIPKTITGYYNGAFYWDNINSDLINNGAVSYASGFSDYSASFATSLRKSGNVISLVINCNKSSNFEIGASVKIMDLPTGYRPTTNVTFAGDNCTFLVGSDGTVYATPKSGITTLVSGSVSYIN